MTEMYELQQKLKSLFNSEKNHFLYRKEKIVIIRHLSTYTKKYVN